MKAIALTGVNSASLIDVASEAAAEGDVVIRMRGLGLCGSDLSRYAGHRPVPSYPWVIGHEGFGTIVGVGPGVDAARIGETVVIEPIVGCGACGVCSGGSTALCSDRRVMGMTEPGIGAEYVAFPASHVHAVPSSWSAETLGCVEPAAVAVKAVDLAQVTTSDEVLVVGGGAQGLFISMLLRARGIRVSVSEINPEKAEFVAKLGIPLAAATGTYSCVFEASGSVGGFKHALESVDFGGAIMLVGMGAAPLEFTSEALVLRQVRILTSYVYDHPHGFTGAIDAIKSGAIDADGVVSVIVGASDVQSAYELALTSAGKVVISFEEWGSQ